MYFFFLSYFNKFLKNTSFPKNVNFVMIDFFFFKLKKVYDVRCFKETPAVSNDNAITSSDAQGFSLQSLWGILSCHWNYLLWKS